MAEKTSAVKPGPPKVTPLRGRDNRRPSLFAVANRLRKKRDGTPEKSATPSQEPDENLTPAKQVIWDQELEKLQIKQEELQKTWQPRPPASDAPPVVRKVPVQKAKKLLDEDKPKSRMISVAKPAPPDAPVKPMDYTGYAGPRYDQHGAVIQHSLLGTVEDFTRESGRRAALPGAPELPACDMDRSGTPTVKYEKKRRGRDVRLSRDDNNALRHWQLKMLERKRQQGYISKLLQKDPADLAMNQADNFRQVQEQRHLIDRTIPGVDYGKGYRVGSEFWHQQEQFGDDLAGLHMTLSQSQRGYPPPVMHVGLSQVVKEEKGSEWLGRRSPHMNYPWHKSEFLSQRKGQLQPYMEEMDPFKPDFDSLQVIGSNQPSRSAEDEQKEKDEEFDKFLDSYGGHGLTAPMDEDMEHDGVLEDSAAPPPSDREEVVKKEPVFGPSLLFGGQTAQWTGDSFSFKDQVGIEARVTFEALTGDRVTSHLQLINDGTTSIYYDWKKMTKENPFDLVQAQVQRFYFNNSSGVILPGETLKFPYVFKSPNAGVFTEQWRLETRPVVCGGASLLVTLRGVALQEDKFKKQREELERELVQKQAKQVVSQLLSDVIAGIRTPERSRSPVDAYITEEEIFCRNNPGLQYSHQDVAQLKELYAQLWDEEVRAENVWSLSIPDLQDSIMEHAEDDERRENLLHQMNLVAGKLSYLSHTSVQQQLQSTGYLLFQEAIDRIVGESLLLRHTKCLPDRAQDEIDGDINRLRSSDSRKGLRGVDSKAKVDPVKDKGRATGRDSKAAKVPPAKPDPKGKTTPGPAPKKTPTPVKNAPTPSRALTPAERESGVEGLNSQPSSPEPGVGGMSDVELAMAEKLYKESFSVQVYDILGEMVDKMDLLFSGIKNNAV